MSPVGEQRPIATPPCEHFGESTRVDATRFYRFHKKSELAMNFLGLFCAIVAGATQVRYTIDILVI